MRKEIQHILTCKRFWLAALIWFFSFVQEGRYLWLGGPIGIFENWNSYYEILKRFAPVFFMSAPSKAAVFEHFYSNYGICQNAAAQLARNFTDHLGSDFYIFSFLIGAFLIPDSNRTNSTIIHNICPKTIGQKYSAAVICTMIPLSLLTTVPFLLSFRLNDIGLNGSPYSFWHYLFVWILPTVLVLYSVQIFTGVLFHSHIVTVAIHFFLMLFMNSPAVTAYPLYKFIIRFNGCSEQFYYDMKNQITANRIFVSVLSLLLLGASMWIARNKANLPPERIS